MINYTKLLLLLILALSMGCSKDDEGKQPTDESLYFPSNTDSNW